MVTILLKFIYCNFNGLIFSCSIIVRNNRDGRNTPATITVQTVLGVPFILLLMVHHGTNLNVFKQLLLVLPSIDEYEQLMLFLPGVEEYEQLMLFLPGVEE